VCVCTYDYVSSPHLVEVRERIRINGRPLSRDAFSQYFWHCYHRLDETKVYIDELFLFRLQLTAVTSA